MSEGLVTRRRIVYETLSVESASEDLAAVLDSARIRPVGLCNDGTSEPTHVVMCREDYLALVGIRDKWLRGMMQEPEFAAELVGAKSAL